MSRARRVVAAGVASALMLSVAAFPALAINNGRVPADQCAPERASVVGLPQDMANPGLAQSTQVGGPASVNNPGQEMSPGVTGAEGEERSAEGLNCPAVR